MIIFCTVKTTLEHQADAVIMPINLRSGEYMHPPEFKESDLSLEEFKLKEIQQTIKMFQDKMPDYVGSDFKVELTPVGLNAVIATRYTIMEDFQTSRCPSKIVKYFRADDKKDAIYFARLVAQTEHPMRRFTLYSSKGHEYIHVDLCDEKLPSQLKQEKDNLHSEFATEPVLNGLTSFISRVYYAMSLYAEEIRPELGHEHSDKVYAMRQAGEVDRVAGYILKHLHEILGVDNLTDLVRKATKFEVEKRMQEKMDAIKEELKNE